MTDEEICARFVWGGGGVGDDWTEGALMQALLSFGVADEKRFALRAIVIDSTSWPTHADFIDPLIVPKGYELVVRQRDCMVKVYRRKIKPGG